MTPILETIDLVKVYPGLRAVDGISFRIQPGEVFGLLGPNGAGKTTTIEMIEGILKPTSGEIRYKGRRRGSRFREEVGIQLQTTELPMYLTVKETLALYRGLYADTLDMETVIRTCNLADIQDRDNRKISGGQRQRLLLAIAIANDPDLIFLDEPTTGLDPQARRNLWEVVGGIRSQKKTVVITTHYMEEAEILCDRIAIMDRGRIITMGPPKELLMSHLGGSVISLSDTGLMDRLTDFPCRFKNTGTRIEIPARDPDQCIRELVRRDVPLRSLTVRSANLEDLFLKLTGRNLRD